MANTIQRRKKRFKAWVVYWYIREDKVAKTTGTVITLLPNRYSIDTVTKIVEALYCAYTQTYDGQFGYIVGRGRGKRVSRRTFDRRVEIPENPGLTAVLAEDVCIENDSSSGNTQIISWTDPDYYEGIAEHPRIRKVGDGQRHKLKFDFFNYEETNLA